MADPNAPELSEGIEKELSVGKFTLQQARTLGFQLGGVALGLAAGLGLAKTGFKNTVGKWINNYILGKKILPPAETAKIIANSTEIARKWVIPGFGVVAGSVIGGIASLYEHWVKVEREQLGVKEINKDVASLMEKRVQFEDTLDKQHAIIKDMLQKHEAAAGQGMGDKVLATKESAASSQQART